MPLNLVLAVLLLLVLDLKSNQLESQEATRIPHDDLRRELLRQVSALAIHVLTIAVALYATFLWFEWIL